MFQILFLIKNIFVTLCIAIIFCCLLRLFNIDKKLYKVICIALLLHVILSLVIQADFYKYYHPEVRRTIFFNDGECYSSNALIISKTLRGEVPQLSELQKIPGWGYVLVKVLKAAQSHEIVNINEYQIGFITYFYSIIYAAYGYIPSYINTLNILLNLLTGIIIFKMCDMLFNRKAGYIALILFLFNPILFYYSTMKLKESLYIFAFYLSIYLAILTVRKKDIVRFLLIIPLLFLVRSVKAMFFWPFLFVLAVYFIINLFSKRKLLFVVMPILSVFFLLKFSFICEKGYKFFIASLQYHQGVLLTGGHTYRLLIFGPDIFHYNNMQKILSFVNAWYHLLLEPVLTTNMSFTLLAYYPVKIIFAFLYILGFLGTISAFRYRAHNYRENILLLSFLFFIGSIIAMTSGNIGTMLRHRDLITPIIFIYASYFMSNMSVKRA